MLKHQLVRRHRLHLKAQQVGDCLNPNIAWLVQAMPVKMETGWQDFSFEVAHLNRQETRLTTLLKTTAKLQQEM